MRTTHSNKLRSHSKSYSALDEKEQMEEYYRYLIATAPDNRMPEVKTGLLAAGLGDSELSLSFEAQHEKIQSQLLTSKAIDPEQLFPETKQ